VRASAAKATQSSNACNAIAQTYLSVGALSVAGDAKKGNATER
jgi:hypothetical protein